jgi:hypothetical protein
LLDVDLEMTAKLISHVRDIWRQARMFRDEGGIDIRDAPAMPMQEFDGGIEKCGARLKPCYFLHGKPLSNIAKGDGTEQSIN